jgi:hypothetical protein
MTNHQEDEILRIYKALFFSPPPPIIRDRFGQAVALLSAGFSEEDRRKEAEAAGRIRDLEALEMAARWTGRLPVLTWKFRLMARLGETRPENRSLLINLRDRRLRAFVQIFLAGLRSAWKLGKGLVLLWRVRHV